MVDKGFRLPPGSVEFGQHVAYGLATDDARLVAMRRTGGDVDHVTRSGLNRMIVETVADPA